MRRRVDRRSRSRSRAGCAACAADDIASTAGSADIVSRLAGCGSDVKRSPAGGTVAITYDALPNGGLTSAIVTEQRCAAWWRRRVDAANVSIAIIERDRCLTMWGYDRVQARHIEVDPSVRSISGM
jgi:hypothetical protein